MEDNKNDTEFEEDTLREKAEELKNSGNEAYRKKEFSKAISFYTEGIKTQCKDIVLVSQLYNNRSTVYFYLGNFPDCLSDVNDAIALQPSYLKAIIRGANACLKLKQSEEAIIWCDKGLAIENDNQDLLKTKRTLAEVHKSAGNKAFAKHDFCQAIYFYTEGIKVNCRDEKLNAKLYHNRATGNFYSGNYQDSLSDSKVAVSLHPTYLKAIVRGATTCVKLKKFGEAKKWCEQGLSVSFIVFDL